MKLVSVSEAQSWTALHTEETGEHGRAGLGVGQDSATTSDKRAHTVMRTSVLIAQHIYETTYDRFKDVFYTPLSAIKQKKTVSDSVNIKFQHTLAKMSL